MTHLNAFQKGIENLAGKYHLWQVFEDWTECAACELMQATFEHWGRANG